MTGSAVTVTLPANLNTLVVQATGGNIDFAFNGTDDPYPILQGQQLVIQVRELANYSIYLTGTNLVLAHTIQITELMGGQS